MAELQKTLSYPVILLITINSIMGTGIFFLPAVGAATSGPASILAWFILSFICLYIAACFGELTSMFPNAGGVYEFCKQAYGRFTSFIIGWMTFVAGNITIAMLIVGAIQYLAPVGNINVKIGVCLFFILAFNYIAYKGMDTSAVMLVTFAFITLGTVFALIIPGFLKFNIGNYDPFFVKPISTVFLTLFLIAETYFGWETATFLAGETKDGAKVMPKALIIGTVLMCIIGFLSVVSAMGLLNWSAYGLSKAPLTDLAIAAYGGGAGNIFTILVYLAIIGSVAGWIVSAPRLILSMAEDKLFPRTLAEVHPVNKTPYKAIIFQTIVVSVLVFMAAGSYETLLHLLVPMLLIMYSAVLISLLVLRRKMPEQERFFKVPFAWPGIILSIAFLVFLLLMWLFNTAGAGHSFRLGLSFVAVGIPVYFLIEMYYDPKAIRIVSDFFASLNRLIDWFTVPKKVRREVITTLGNISSQSVLEFGCSVGSLTPTLAAAVGPEGKIYATNISMIELKMTQKRVNRKGHKHVRLIHDPEHHSRVHPMVPEVDAVVSMGMLGYVQDMRTVLDDLYARLKFGGKFCFIDYDKFFGFIPNVEWISSDEKIKSFFKESGFIVNVKRKGTFPWQFVYIYGVKYKKGEEAVYI